MKSHTKEEWTNILLSNIQRNKQIKQNNPNFATSPYTPQYKTKQIIQPKQSRNRDLDWKPSYRPITSTQSQQYVFKPSTKLVGSYHQKNTCRNIFSPDTQQPRVRNEYQVPKYYKKENDRKTMLGQDIRDNPNWHSNVFSTKQQQPHKINPRQFMPSDNLKSVIEYKDAPRFRDNMTDKAKFRQFKSK